MYVGLEKKPYVNVWIIKFIKCATYDEKYGNFSHGAEVVNESQETSLYRKKKIPAFAGSGKVQVYDGLEIGETICIVSNLQYALSAIDCFYLPFLFWYFTSLRFRIYLK